MIVSPFKECNGYWTTFTKPSVMLMIGLSVLTLLGQRTVRAHHFLLV